MNDLFRGMDRPTLDRAYNNVQAVSDFPAVMAKFQALSANLYANAQCQRNLAYGPQPRQRFDCFNPAPATAPTLIFIHGGYWQNCTKEDFAFIGAGPLAAGFNVVLVEYSLAPQANMTQIVNEIGALLDHLAEHAESLNIGAGPVILSGHSAGGQLTALHRHHPFITHSMPVSGLMELEPISLCWLNEKLQLSAAEVSAYSPQRQIRPGLPMLISVGSDELPELVRQSSDYAHACIEAGEPAVYCPVPGADHFSVLEDLASAEGVQIKALLRLLG